MATIKLYTNLEQSKKLVEILPLESSDMYWRSLNINGHISWTSHIKKIEPPLYDFEHYAPCWSLAALLYILPYPQLSKDKLGGGKEGWMVSVYPNNCRYDSYWHDNPVDACYEIILKLHELNIIVNH